MARCLWMDPDVPGAGSRNVDQMLEIQLDPSGNGWTATATLASGGSGGRWNAKRVMPRQRRPGERLSTAGICKNKEIFERLTQSKSSTQLDLERTKNLETSLKSQASFKNGMLYEMPPLCVSDPFVDPTGNQPEPRTGRSMLSGRPKSGRVGPGTAFSLTPCLGIGDPYEVPAKRLFQAKLEQQRKAVIESGFQDRPAFRVSQSVPVRDGTLYLSEVDGDAPREVLRQAVSRASLERTASRTKLTPTTPKNFLTNPMKKGGPGTPGVLLSHKSKDQLGIVAYAPEPFEADREKRKEEKLKDIQARGDRPPFLAKVHVPKDSQFSTNEELYHDLGPGGPSRPSSAPAGARRSASAGTLRSTAKGGMEAPQSPASHNSQKEELPPYRPPYQHHRDGTFNDFPAHLPDPLPIKVFQKREKTDAPIWKPSTPAKSKPSCSILTSKLNVMSRLR